MIVSNTTVIPSHVEDAGVKDYNVPGLRRLKKTERGHGRIGRREYLIDFPAVQISRVRAARSSD